MAALFVVGVGATVTGVILRWVAWLYKQRPFAAPLARWSFRMFIIGIILVVLVVLGHGPLLRFLAARS